MHREFIKLAFDLETTNDNQVVKVAGVLRKIKNWFKSLFSSKYNEELSQLKDHSQNVRQSAERLDVLIDELMAAINDGDIVAYNKHLSVLKEEIKVLWLVLDTVNKETDIIKYVTKDDLRMPGMQEKIKGILPTTYDIKLDEQYNKPLKSFNWYKDLKPDDIVVESEGFITLLKNRLQKLLVQTHHKNKEEAAQYLNDNISEIIHRLKLSVIDSTLVIASLRSPYKGVEKIRAGETVITVITGIISLPIYDIRFQTEAKLIDWKTSAQPRNRMSFKAIGTIFNISPIPPKKASIKLGAVNPGAYKNLSDSFWDEFVATARRLGMKPEWLAMLIYEESAFDSTAQNIQNGKPIAKGFNQFTQVGARGVGMPPGLWDSFENTSPEEQLKWAEKAFRGIQKATGHKEWNDPVQLFVANFAPGFLTKSSDPEFILYRKFNEDGSLTKAYLANKARFGNRDSIKVKDIRAIMPAVSSTGVSHGRVLPTGLVQKIRDAENRASPNVEKEEKPEEKTELKSNSPDDENVSNEDLDEIDSGIKELFASKDNSLVKVSLDIQANDFQSKLEFARVVSNGIKRITKSAFIISTDSLSKVQININCKEAYKKDIVEFCQLVSNEFKNRYNVNALANISDENKTLSHVKLGMLLSNKKKFAFRVIYE